ncbi:unnamed protein product [Amoebophrya sp. A120]|nr:unnamed protein product [Amoebophrya sp. A120]|eukprot:GSA120T00024618001.1
MPSIASTEESEANKKKEDTKMRQECRVAVCISGAMRAFLDAFPTFLEFVEKKNDECTLDYFAHFNWDPEHDIAAAKALFPTEKAYKKAVAKGTLEFFSNETKKDFEDAIANTETDKDQAENSESDEEDTADGKKPKTGAAKTTSATFRNVRWRQVLISTNNETVQEMMTRTKAEILSDKDLYHQHIEQNFEQLIKEPTARGMVPFRVLAMAMSIELAHEQLEKGLKLRKGTENEVRYDLFIRTRPDISFKRELDLYVPFHMSLTDDPEGRDQDEPDPIGRKRHPPDTIYLPWWSDPSPKPHAFDALNDPGLAFDQFAVANSLQVIRHYTSFRKYVAKRFAELVMSTTPLHVPGDSEESSEEEEAAAPMTTSTTTPAPSNIKTLNDKNSTALYDGHSAPDLVALGKEVAKSRNGVWSRMDVDFYPEKLLFDLLAVNPKPSDPNLKKKLRFALLGDFRATLLRPNGVEADPFGKLKEHYPDADAYPRSWVPGAREDL